VVNDLFGNVAGTVGGDLSFKSSLRVGAYGPLPGQTAVDTGNLLQSLATATVWQGRRLDPTGFYWMGARYYDPGTGRFLSPDPLGHGASLSLYDYAGGDPVNQLDPDGRCVSKVPSYNGDFPSPLNVMNYTPKSNELNKMYYTPSEIRGWVNDAANYHHVPPLMLATILQQDNGPNATGIRKLLQFAERELTTGLATADSMLFDLLPDKIMGKNITGGSSGLANMSRTTLQGAANYIQTAYNRSPMPSGVQYRVLGINVDTRIPAYDRRADLYYASAHLRQLIDYVTGQQGFDANQLTIEQAQNVFKKYNGSGVQAVKYGEDAVQRIYNAMGGKEPLYFFQK
jgi:RHS repeat-associated protein